MTDISYINEAFAYPPPLRGVGANAPGGGNSIALILADNSGFHNRIPSFFGPDSRHKDRADNSFNTLLLGGKAV